MECRKKYPLEKLDFFHSIEVIFPGYFQSIQSIFPYHGKHFRIKELDKTMEIGFSNLYLQYFQNTSILWKRPDFCSDHNHVIGFSDLVDLWVIKIKKPMILCAHSTSRPSEQSTKRRSRSENM